MVTLCTVRTIGRCLLRCWAALTRPLATATFFCVTGRLYPGAGCGLVSK